MITNLTLNDNTQKQVLNHLITTDKLLSSLSSKLSHTEKQAHIYGMPDLGIPHNATRVLGGFYTGACYTWDCDVPFVPIDSTVNVCGTGVYRLTEPISTTEFHNRVTNIFKNNTQYIWNYDQGNHFVILAYSDGKEGLPEGQYLVVHASALEYKKDLKKGLYPVKGNWFYDSIKIEEDVSTHRYLRYIDGKKAERFYAIAETLKAFNETRNLEFAHLVLGNLFDEEILNISHYGIPTINSVCIGTQWENKAYTLLTSPGKDISLIQPVQDTHYANYFVHNNKEFLLSTHGLGLEFMERDTALTYLQDAFQIGTNTFSLGDSIAIDVYTKVRDYTSHTVDSILEKCPGTVIGTLHQICAINKDGYKEYDLVSL